MRISTRIKGNRLLYSVSFILLTMLIIQPIPSSAYTYEMSEDFQDQELSDWNLRTDVWNNNEATTTPDHWTYDAGYLESDGDFIEDNWNLATHSQIVAFGVWQLDVFYPIIESVFPFDFNVVLSDDFWGGFHGKTTYSSFERTRNGTFIAFSQVRMDVYNVSIANRANVGDSVIPSTPPLDGTWAHYDIVKTPDRFMVLIDNTVEGNFTYTDGLNQYGNFTLMSPIGSHVRFDNIMFTPDYQEFIDNIPKDNTKSTKSSATVLLVSFGGLAAVSTLSYSYHKKKD